MFLSSMIHESLFSSQWGSPLIISLKRVLDKLGEHGCRSGESARLPPVWSGFDSGPVIFNNYSPKWRQISTTFTDTEVNNCFSIYHTS